MTTKWMIEILHYLPFLRESYHHSRLFFNNSDNLPTYWQKWKTFLHDKLEEWPPGSNREQNRGNGPHVEIQSNIMLITTTYGDNSIWLAYENKE